jgi:hypothetical protein
VADESFCIPRVPFRACPDCRSSTDALQNDPFINAHLAWIAAIKQLLEMRVRAEQQALAKWSLNYVIEKYLPVKARGQKWFFAVIFLMSFHHGPKWMSDQTRPGAIEAQHQAEEFHNEIRDAQQKIQANSERLVNSGNSPAKHFRQAALAFFSFCSFNFTSFRKLNHSC